KRVRLDDKNFIIAHARDLRTLHEYMEVNARMQFMFDSVPLVLTFWDKDLNMVECNEDAVRRFSLSCKQEFKERFFDLSPEFQPDGSPSTERAMEYLREGFAVGHVEFEWMHRDFSGTDIPTEVLCFRSEYQGEEILFACSRDLRELKASQQREREMSNRIQLMFNATPLVIQYWGRDYKCIECNKTTLDFYGVDSIEEHDSRLLDFLPEFQPNGKPSWEQWTLHLEKIFTEGYTRFDFSVEKHGGTIFLEVLGVRMKYNDDLVVVTYSNDVTQLKQTLIRMREADERTKLMLGGTPIACYLINKDFEAIDCNNETLNLFDFEDKGEGIVKFREVFSKHWSSEMEKHFAKAIETGNERFEWVLQKPRNSESIPCDITFIRFTHRSEYVVAAYIFDLRVMKEMLRERQRMEIAEESSRAKSRFLARMSHEIRTPLSAVLGISEIQLQDPALTTGTEEAFAKIHNSASTLLGIVNDILDLSKIEAGKLSIINDRYEVASMIGDIVQLHLVFMGNKKIKFRIFVDDKIPAFLIGDELRIKQVLNNLLSNAFKYTEEGAVELSINCQEDEEENHVALVISIRDSGMGMSQEQVDILCDDYTRFHEREKRLVDGTGLGMPIVYNLVQMMSGKLDVESEVGKGTNIIVRIPQEIASHELLGTETANSLQQFEIAMGVTAKRFKFVPEPMPYGSVLVVDDVSANLYVAQGLLRFYDLKIETCDSGFEAIERVRQGNVYDIIFMDHMMPKLDGAETTERLRNMGYTHPIVALTANALIGQAEEFMRNGFDGFISKPIQTMHLNTILTKFIRDKQPQDVIDMARKAGSKPASSGGIDNYLDRPDVAIKLRVDFAKSQKNVLSDIKWALEARDTKTAHRLAHTLKGLAGVIKESRLVNVSADLERMLMQGETGEEVTRQVALLEQELTPVLESMKKELADSGIALPPGRVLDRNRTMELLDRLAELLAADSAENLELIEELRGVPEAAILVKQVEDFDFDAASKTLVTLKEILEA
ncbi:MAG: ATP-binding protein, partial [Treponema sp.]|nr:ATP-binding protein [Treponema sp.]